MAPPHRPASSRQGQPKASDADVLQASHQLIAAGMTCHQSGRLAEAEQLYTRALELDPSNDQVLYLRGTLFFQVGRTDAGIRDITASLRINPNNPYALNNLGTVLRERGQLAEAIARYTAAVRLKPDYLDALRNLALALKEHGQLAEAVVRYTEALRVKPDEPELLNNLGVALQGQGRLDEAVSRHTEALRLKPDYPEALNNLGSALQAQGKLDQAIARYTEALRRKPGFFQALNNLGIALQAQGKLDEAIARHTEALRLKPDYLDALNSLGIALQAQGDLDGALGRYAEALRLKPDYPEAHWNEALTRLLAGDFEAGWAKYQWRWMKKDKKPHGHRQPLWDGSALDGKTILIHCEQGFGDSIQFVRYAQLVKNRGGTVVLLCPPLLERLLETAPGVDRLISNSADLPPCDYQVPLLTLPFIFKTILETIPARVPYLAASPALTAQWRRRLEGLAGLKIGVVWQGNPNCDADRGRSYPLAALAPLAAVDGVRLISLQRRDGLDQLAALPAGMAVTTLGDEVDAGGDAFIDTAAIMAGLDLVVSSDTAVAHLAGALGVPVWVALQRVPDWRWLLERENCPWYPTMRLFRQTTAGDWAGVFARIAAELIPFRR